MIKSSLTLQSSSCASHDCRFKILLSSVDATENLYVKENRFFLGFYGLTNHVQKKRSGKLDKLEVPAVSKSRCRTANLATATPRNLRLAASTTSSFLPLLSLLLSLANSSASLEPNLPT